MNNNKVTIEVSFWAEGEKAYKLLTFKRGETWSKGQWFPKSLCKYDHNTNLLTLPKWLYEKKFQE